MCQLLQKAFTHFSGECSTREFIHYFTWLDSKPYVSFNHHSPIHLPFRMPKEVNILGMMAKLTFSKLLSDIESLWERTCSQCNFTNKLLALKSFECYTGLVFHSIASVPKLTTFLASKTTFKRGFHLSLRDKARYLLFEDIHIGFHIW